MLTSGCTSHFYNLLIFHRAVSLLFISNRFETSLFTGKTSVFSSAGQRALSSAELGAFIRDSYRPRTFLSTFQIGIERRGAPSKLPRIVRATRRDPLQKKLHSTTRDCPIADQGEQTNKVQSGQPIFDPPTQFFRRSAYVKKVSSFH